MVEKGEFDWMDFYSNAFRNWSDVSQSWVKTMGAPAFQMPSIDSWVGNYKKHTDDWGKIYGGMMDTAKMFPMGPANEFNQATVKLIDSYVKIYSAWLSSVEKMSKKAYDALSGKEVDIDGLVNIWKDSYDEIMDVYAGALEGVPFTGVKEINDNLNKIMESFPEEQEQYKEAYKKWVEFNGKVINTWSSRAGDISKKFTEMMRNGEISPDAYREVINLYGNTYKDFLGIVASAPSHVSLEGVVGPYGEIVDKSIELTGKHVDASLAWFEIYLKLYKGLERASGEIFELAGDTFREGEIGSFPDFYNKWMDLSGKAYNKMAETAEPSKSIATFVEKSLECMRASSDLHQLASTSVPYPSKEDVNKINAEIEDIKTSIAQKAKSDKKAKSGKKE